MDPEVEKALSEATQDRRTNTAIKLAALLKATGMGESWVTLTYHDIDAAMVEALDKHGRPTSDPQRGICRAAEELGEAAKEAADAVGPGHRQPHPPDATALRRMYKELCQLAAYSALLATSMKLLAREVENGHGKR